MFSRSFTVADWAALAGNFARMKTGRPAEGRRALALTIATHARSAFIFLPRLVQ